MAGPPTAAFSKVTLRFGGSALPHGAACGFGFTTPVGPVEDVNDAIYNFAAEIMTYLTIDVTCLDALWKVGPEETGPTAVVPINYAGERNFASAPPQVTTLVSLIPSGISGRFAGRVYLPGVEEDRVSNSGALEGTYRNDLQGALEAAYAVMALVSAEPVVFSSLGGDPRPVTVVQVQGQTASQRRRNRR